ncbi:hypothetical protein [Aureicoccus marinus]|uniref:Uncharacterized protein n=1 Tax=Aureicoccus marinus TaxID=754435 RepID=A0A2S7T9G1_9FLAO|nr:hypothetical protein [Aureicoccus marinus]PQJ16570.1 hypothetical protein BST99_13325 [Aureicoccus marinus]
MNLTEHLFLDSFFKIFDARLDITGIVKDTVYGTLKWEDEDDEQDIKWTKSFKDSDIELLTKLCDFLLQNKLTRGDKIDVTEDLLFEKLLANDWTIEKAKKAIESLMDLEVRMLDDGKETDSFYIHF